MNTPEKNTTAKKRTRRYRRLPQKITPTVQESDVSLQETADEYKQKQEAEKNEIREKTGNDDVEISPHPIRQGRARNPNFLSWEEAKEFVRGEMIPSRNKYEEWWQRNKPKCLPRFPYRSYVAEWVSWNDFLGTHNEFGAYIGKKWRSLEEASVYVHTLKIENYNRWMEYCKTNTLPDDIPVRPDLVYSKWKTWNHWLGNRPIEAMEVKKEALRTQVFYIIREKHNPENVLTYGLNPAGLADMKDRWEREKFDVVRLFWFDPDNNDKIQQIINVFSTPYLGDDTQRLTPNVWEIIYRFEMLLTSIRRA